MASIMCKKCNTGIHYHSEPNGIEYTFIKENDWIIICNSCFDGKAKEMDTEKYYPKLFRTDTIEEDFSELIYKAWKCPACGSIIIFDAKGQPWKTYEICNEEKVLL
ncbi:MAG: hypothetical protein IKO61_04650 [Lachnospiraceae bacterium]|nr:hypothetical protein [Lachnospiraceae bacterium]